MESKTIRIQVNKVLGVNKISPAKVHLLPCKVHADCDAKVSKYFSNYIEENPNGYLVASFRGYPLKGDRIRIPDGYTGVVLQESKCVQKDHRTLFPMNNFDHFTYWNWNKIPNKSDAIKQALDWIDIADALHSPFNDESSVMI